MDILHTLGEVGLGSRLNRLSDLLMKEIQGIYKSQNVDFDPYLFPAFHAIANLELSTNTELCEALFTSQPAVTQTINKLLSKGLIAQQIDPVDKRKKVIRLSKKGEQLHQDLQPLWNIFDASVKEFTILPADSLLQHLTLFETSIKNGDFKQSIMEKINSEKGITIVPFKNQHATPFYDLNIEWLETYFYVEDYDREVLSQPLKFIIEPGGHIFSAIENNKVLGTVALLKRDEGVFELSKMAVLSNQRGKRIGQQLMQYCIDYAREHNFKGLYLYSNTVLENAIHIYRKFGFQEVPIPEDNPYKRSNIRMVFPL